MDYDHYHYCSDYYRYVFRPYTVGVALEMDGYNE